MPFRFLDDIAIADVAFEASGSTLEELFVAAGQATSQVMVNIAGITPQVERTLFLENEDIERLMYDFLEHLVYLKDADQLLFGTFVVKIKKNTRYVLSAKVLGEKINPSRHELRNDVKAVTLHMFEVKQVEDEWTARVVLDI